MADIQDSPQPAPPVCVGTSGWHYGHWRGVLYPTELPADAWLPYYAARFHCVEVNSSYYRLPAPATVDRWRETTPEGFRLAVKAPRSITHVHKLRNCAPLIAELLTLVGRLGPKLGPILFQLPPRWHCNARRLDEFLAGLPAGLRYAVEPRDPSWHNAEVYDVLRRHQAAFCIYDLGGDTTPLELTADFAYLRLHGPRARYCGSYGAPRLRAWAGILRGWQAHGCGAWVFLNNDESGHAVRNARLLLKALMPQGVDEAMV